MSLVVPFKEIFEDATGLLARHESWARVELGEVCRIVNGFPFKSALFNRDRGFPVVRIRDLSKGVTETMYNGKVPAEVIVTDRDLLVGMDGIFRCHEWRGGEAGLNQRVCKIVPNEQFLNRKFLLFGINGYLRGIEDATSSVTVGHLSSKDILRIPFPLPPLAEQHRIVERLDALLAKGDGCQTRLAKIPVLLERFRQSVLAAACSGRLTADWREAASTNDLASTKPANLRAGMQVDELFETPASWRWAPLRALCDSTRAICYGVIKLGADHPSGVPCLRTSDVRRLRIDTGEVKRIAPEISNRYRRTLLCGGEVLVNVRGTLGGVAVVPPGLRGWNISREVAVVPVSRVAPKFVAFWIASLVCQNWLTGVAKGAAYTGINIEDLRLLPVALPSQAEQKEIVGRVEALFALTDEVEIRAARGQAHVDRLTPSLLAKAFCGELVATEADLAGREGRSFESASVLLERIRAEAASSGKRTSSRSPRRGGPSGRRPLAAGSSRRRART